MVIMTLGVTLTAAVAVLLPGSGSVSLADAVAELVSGLVAKGSTVTTMVMAALPPLAMGPRLQVMVLVPLHAPWLGVAETRVTFAGRVSITVTPVAFEGPLLVMLRL
jgi:hypothetical protein